MSAAPSRPNVLIVGGLTSVSRQFAQSLFPANGPPLVDRLRIVDKYMVNPPTTYIGPIFPQLVQRPHVEYSQNNLTLPERLAAVFEPPDNGRPWDLVFDFLGELTYDANERTQILQTYKASVNCALEAARRGTVKAYVRLTFGFYHCSTDRLHTEEEELEPDGVRGVWWHETLRSLAGIRNLPLVIIRAGIPYGPYCSWGLTQRILIGEVYRYKQRKMRYLWSPQLRLNTVHTDDISGACWEAAMWMASVGRSAAIDQAGVPMYYGNDPGKEFPQGLPAVVPPDQAPKAPLFNLVDASDSNQISVGQAIAAVYNITLGFRNVPPGVDADWLAGDINIWHGEVWYNLCQMNSPKIEYPPMSTWIEAHDLSDQASAWDGSKFLRIVRYRLKRPQLTSDAIDQIVSLFKREGVFPVVDGVDPDDEDEEDDEEEEEYDDEEEE